MTSIADMVSRLIAAGTPPELAASVVAEAFAAGAVGRQSAEHPVDAATEKRRAYDRERQRKIRELRRQSADNPPMSQQDLSLSSPSKDSDQPKEVKKVRARKHPLSADWQPKPEHFEAGAKRNYSRQAVLEKAEDMRIWAGSSGATKVDWDLTFHGFLRRDAPRFVANGSHAPRPGSKDDTRERTINALRSLDPFPRTDEPGPGQGARAEISGLLPFAKPA